MCKVVGVKDLQGNEVEVGLTRVAVGVFDEEAMASKNPLINLTS